MRQVCAELPVEDVTHLDHQMNHVGHLLMSLYGIRDVAMNWQEKVAKRMQGCGVTGGEYNPCVYWNDKTGLNDHGTWG